MSPIPVHKLNFSFNLKQKLKKYVWHALTFFVKFLFFLGFVKILVVICSHQETMPNSNKSWCLELCRVVDRQKNNCLKQLLLEQIKGQPIEWHGNSC